MAKYDENCLHDHAGVRYSIILSWIHELATPDLYFEIGTLTGDTLRLSSCESIAVDPAFKLQGSDAIQTQKVLHLYQTTSDEFFAKYSFDISRKIDVAFLDGMHHCEYLLRDFYNTERCAAPNAIIGMHDCLPLDVPMTCRDQFGFQSAIPERNGWWTGDVWRVVSALQKFRPDLKITCLDAEPTGLVLVTGLNPHSRVLADRYDEVFGYMHSLDLERITIAKLFDEFGVRRTPSKDALMGTLY